MVNINSTGSVQNELNRASPAAADAKLGDVLADLLARVNVLTSALNIVTAKLDLDAGVTDTNYGVLGAVPAAVLKDLESRY